MAKKRKPRKPRTSSARQKPKSVPKKMAVGFDAALKLVRRKRWAEALDEFQKLNQQFPNRPEILTELVNICYELQNMHLYLRYIEHLVRYDKDPDIQFSLAGAYMMNGYLLLAHQLYEQFLSRYPNHERIEDARKAKSMLDPEVEKIVADLDFSGPIFTSWPPSTTGCGPIWSGAIFGRAGKQPFDFSKRNPILLRYSTT